MPGFARGLARCFTVQASWNYETMMGIGFGWAAEPAMSALEGGPGGARYRAARARESRFFNAHPYLAGLAVGAAVRAELDGEDPARIERLRAALCGPLGSVGDRLFWASWLPACSALALILVAAGARGWAVVAFLALYNVAHLGCRWWALRAGGTQGLHVGAALSAPVLRRASEAAGPAAALCVRAMLPLLFGWQLRGAPGSAVGLGFVGVVAVAVLIRLFATRLNGMAVAAVVLAVAWGIGRVWP